MKKIIFFVLFLNAFIGIDAQDLPIYNHYFIYPNLYNPSYLGLSEYSEITLLHRQQWVGIDGAPVVSNLGLQMPISEKMAFGVNIGNTESGLLTSTLANGSFAYTLNLQSRTYLSFGVSLGAGRQSIDVSQINDLTDPAIAGALDKSFFLTGQAGLTLQHKKLNIGFALPNLFENEIFSQSDFQEVGLDALNTTISSARYKFDLNPYVSFEPSVLFISNKTSDNQFRGAGTFYIKNLVWLGGIYGKEFGATVFGGLNVNDLLRIGYSYDLNPPQVSGFSNGTHEFFLRFRFGKKKINRSNQSPDLIATTTTEEALDEEIEEEEIEEEETEKEKEKKVKEPKPKREKKTRKKDQEEDTTLTDDPLTENTTENNEKLSNSVDSKADNSTKASEILTTKEKELKAEDIVAKSPPVIEETEKERVRVREEKESTNMDPPPFREDEVKNPEQSAFGDKEDEEHKELERVNAVVTISKGVHNEELGRGYYVVVGSFKSKANAERYQQQLSEGNYASEIGFNTETGFNYVYVSSADVITDVINIKDEYREKNIFQFADTWILRIR